MTIERSPVAAPPRGPAIACRPKPATILDVARAASVSVGTVSRVFNHAPDVKPAIQARVLEAARALNYSRLRHRHKPCAPAAPRSNNVAIVVFGTADPLPSLPVIGPALDGIERALAEHDRNVLFANIPDGDRIPPFLTGGDVEGVIIVGPGQGVLPPESECALLAHLYDYPHVWLLSRLPNARGDHCGFDPEAAATLAAQHLYQNGHRRMAFFHAAPGQAQADRLNKAFLAAAERLSAMPSVLETPARRPLHWPLPATTSQEDVDRLLEAWMKLPLANRPTALFVPSDRTTVQLYAAAQRHGIGIGTDLSVVSCNNEKSLIGELSPTVTSIELNAEFIGERAVAQLLWRIKHRDYPLSVQLLVEPTLAARASVARL